MANGLEEKEQIAPTEEEAAAGLKAIHDGMQHLLDTMSGNISFLEDSVREVRTARQIAAASNRMARRRLLREGNLALKLRG